MTEKSISHLHDQMQLVVIACQNGEEVFLKKKLYPLYVCTQLFSVFLIHHFSLIMTNIFGDCLPF